MKAALRQYVLDKLWQGAGKRIKRDQPRVITVNGSVGKTSAKEAIALVLEQSGRAVVKTHGNMATDLGVPLSLLGFVHPPANSREWLKAVGRTVRLPLTPGKIPYYVVEFSGDKPGDTAFLNSRIPSDAAVLTTLALTHVEGYGTFEAMVEDTVELIKGVRSGGYAVLNADDPEQRRLKITLPVTWYGIT